MNGIGAILSWNFSSTRNSSVSSSVWFPVRNAEQTVTKMCSPLVASIYFCVTGKKAQAKFDHMIENEIIQLVSVVYVTLLTILQEGTKIT